MENSKSKKRKGFIFYFLLIISIIALFKVIATIDKIDDQPILKYLINSDGNSYRVVGCFNADGSEIIIPETYKNLPVIAIDDYAFHKENIVSITLPSTIVSIGEGAFAECPSLKAVYGLEYCKELQQLPKYVFAICTALEDIKLPPNLVYIGECAFIGCDITTIEFPSTLKNIDYGAFVSCVSLSKVTFPDGIENISCSFAQCSSLTDITIPSSVTNLHPGAFNGCINIKNIYVDENNMNFSSIDGIVYSKSKDVLWSYPSGRVDKHFSISSNIRVLAGSCFGHTSLESIYVPKSVTYIETQAFFFSPNLTRINYEGTVSEWLAIEKAWDWDEDASDFTIYCTDGTIAKNGTVTYN